MLNMSTDISIPSTKQSTLERVYMYIHTYKKEKENVEKVSIDFKGGDDEGCKLNIWGEKIKMEEYKFDLKIKKKIEKKKIYRN